MPAHHAWSCACAWESGSLCGFANPFTEKIGPDRSPTLPDGNCVPMMLALSAVACAT